MSLVRVCVTAVIWWVLSASIALACSCVKQTFEDHFRGSDLIFDGVALSTRTVETDPKAGHFQSLQNLVTTFRVTRAIKGTGFDTREIRHHTGSSSCGIGFKIGATYQIYTYRTHDGFDTNSCTRTGDLQRAQYLRRLGSDRPEPGENLSEVIRQIRDPKLKEIDAELLLYAFQRREEEAKADDFIKAYIARAEEAAKEAAAGRIGDHDGALEAAKFFEHWGDYERVAEMFGLVEQVAPRDAYGPAGRGRALYLAGHAEAAIPHLERALRLDPDHKEAASFLARAQLLVTGRLTRGVNDYRNLSTRNLVLDGAKHPGIDFTDARILGLSARGAHLPHAKFWRSGIAFADFRKANLDGASFVAAGIEKGDFSNAVLTDAYAINANFAGGIFVGADLRGMNVSQSSFYGADLRGARLDRSVLAGVDFTRARLDGTRFSGSDFSGADLNNASLLGTDLRGARFAKAELIGARMDCKTRLPKGFDGKRSGLIPVPVECNGAAQNRDFSGRDWKYADFSELDLNGASFAGAKFRSNNNSVSGFVGSTLHNADFSKTSGNVGFSGADLSGADFTGSSLDGWFDGQVADDDGTKARPPALLAGTRFTDAKLITAVFIGWITDPSPPQAADYTLATFDRAQFECSFGNSAERVEREVTEPVEPRDPREIYGPSWDDLSEIERREAIESAKNWQIWEAQSRKMQAEYVKAERKLVTFLRKKWPSVMFGESCQYYLAAPRAKPEN